MFLNLRISTIALGLFLLMHTSASVAQNLESGKAQAWSEDDWQVLTDEPSRDQLQRGHEVDKFESEVIRRQFQFPQDTQNVNSVFGIDVSHYSPNLPFASLAANGVRFVYAKATQGTGFKDPKFSYFWKSLNALPTNARVLRGAYHFLSASEDPTFQAERFVAYVSLQGGMKVDDLPPVADLEWDLSGGRDRWSNLSPAQIVDNVLQFLKRVETLTGRVPMIYTSAAWVKERGISDAEFAKLASYKIWSADYSRSSISRGSPNAPGQLTATVWQFTDQSQIPGVSNSHIDASAFQGRYQDFVELFFEKMLP